MNQQIPVIKKSGESVPFNPEKLRRSLLKAGAGKQDIEEINREILTILKPGISTSEIYRKAYKMLRTREHGVAARYRLKEAIFELGPTGYPFEKFVGALLRFQGYRVKTGVIVEGLCVQHEVDVVASSGNETIMAECKFHSDPGRKSDVKVPLYIDSRFRDIRKRRERDGNKSLFHAWLVTNSRFTGDALDYGTCSGLKLISWDYPQSGSLRQRIDLAGLFPVTCLGTLTRGQKKKILEQDVVLCRELLGNNAVLEKSGIDMRRKSMVLKEVRSLVQGI